MVLAISQPAQEKKLAAGCEIFCMQVDQHFQDNVLPFRKKCVILQIDNLYIILTDLPELYQLADEFEMAVGDNPSLIGEEWK